MKLLYFNLKVDRSDPVLGFASSWVDAIAHRVQSVSLITKYLGEYAPPANVHVRSVGAEQDRSKVQQSLQFYSHLREVIRNERPDVCFSHMMPLFSSMAGQVLRHHNIPLLTWYAHPSITLRLRISNHFSNAIVTSFRNAYPLAHRAVHVIGQGIDTTLFREQEWPNDPGPPIVMCVGRIAPSKKHEVLLAAARILKHQYHASFKLLIVGDPVASGGAEFKQYLETLVCEWGLESEVEFRPGVPREKLPALFRRCKVHVNLTGAGFGDKVALEAMSCARPSVVANPDFIPLLGEYKDSLGFDNTNPLKLANVLAEWLVTDAATCQRVGRYLRTRVIADHSIESLADRVVNTLQSIRG